MQLFINMDHINKLGFLACKGAVYPLKTEKVNKEPWIMAVSMKNGQKIGAYQTSRLNPNAPPYFYITDVSGDGVLNTLPSIVIADRLKQDCKSSDLKEAADYLKAAVMAISNEQVSQNENTE